MIRFACSMDHSIDPCRQWKLTTKQSASINGLSCIMKLNLGLAKLSGLRGDGEGEEKYQKAGRRLKRKRQQQ